MKDETYISLGYDLDCVEMKPIDCQLPIIGMLGKSSISRQTDNILLDTRRATKVNSWIPIDST